MRVLFFGTPAFAVPSLEALLSAGVDVAAVVSQPDRVAARSHSTLVVPPVKQRALAAGIPVWQPERPRGEAFLAEVNALAPDLGVVVAYGHLLRPELLAIPRLGFVNVHASLLPRWRGAAPIQWALLADDRETGVSIMRVEAGLDTGAVWHRAITPIGNDDTVDTLTRRLAQLGARALLEALPRIAHGEQPAPQDEAGATLAPKVDRALAHIRWDEAADAVVGRIRAMDPTPGAWTAFDSQNVKLFGARVFAATPAPPGTVITTHPSLLIACGEFAIDVREVQPAGKRRMPVDEWLRGAPIRPGTRFT
jgi:methionyl-tRNA formyltransferase